jgi:hypothetical protein
MIVPTTSGSVTVPPAGLLGATPNVVGVPSTETTSEFPKEPVHDEGMWSVRLPATKSSSPGLCVQLPVSSGTAVEPPWVPVTAPVCRARRPMLALPSRPAGPVAPAGPAGPRRALTPEWRAAP